MRNELWILLTAFAVGLAAAGCVARVETDPAPARVDVTPARPADVDVKIDTKPGGVDVKVD
jgi:hypothetical protein